MGLVVRLVRGAVRMSWVTHTYETIIHSGMVDSLGHMNNVAYFQLFEDARWDMIISRNYGAEIMKSRQQGPVILSIETQFLKEVMLDERVIVESTTQSYEGKICKLIQELKSESGEKKCTSLYTLGLFDMQARKLIPPSPEWLYACGSSNG